MRRDRTYTAPLSFSLSSSQIRRVEAIAATLPSEVMRNSLRVRVGGKLKAVAWVSVPDELLDNCLASALAEIGAAEAA